MAAMRHEGSVTLSLPDSMDTHEAARLLLREFSTPAAQQELGLLGAATIHGIILRNEMIGYEMSVHFSEAQQDTKQPMSTEIWLQHVVALFREQNTAHAFEKVRIIQ